VNLMGGSAARGEMRETTKATDAKAQILRRAIGWLGVMVTE
jgi:hypothetical protein